MRTRKSLGSGALISIATRRTWRRSMARNMALSACARLRKRANCKARSADAWLNNADPNVSGPFTRRLDVPAHVYIRMMQRRGKLVTAMDHRLVAIDVLAVPTTPTTAPLTAPLLADAELADRTELHLLRNTQVANQFGLTAISLPMPGMISPAGLMLIARGGDDQRLFAIAAAVEGQLKGAA